ncbi:hypothetical protein P3W45_000613 [Vairimorpha bombi]|jgi:nucleolar complex protein 3
MQIDIKDLANLCKKIINEPEKNIKKIKPLLNIKTEEVDDISLVYLSVLKVFKNIIPLYKIRTLKDKIKFKKDDLEINKDDKNILKMYSFFINKICSDTSLISYSVAIEIMEYFEHFNYIDIIVKKILKGTTKTPNISKLCMDSLKKKICDDVNGDLVFCIVNQMYETSFHPDVLSFLLDINLLKEFLEEEVVKKKDDFFKIKRSFKKENRRLEKSRRKLETERRTEEQKEEKQDGFVIHRRIVDGLQRLYFLILRNKIKQKFKYTFIGVRKYKKYIRKEFYEGLYILLNDSINISNYEEKLYCILTIIDIYESYKYDFKRLVQALYNILYAFNPILSTSKLLLIEQVIDHLFINMKQPLKRVHLILERLIILGCIRYNGLIKRIISRLGSPYDVDFNERFKYNETEYFEGEIEDKDIDQMEIKPLYCYTIFKKNL